MAYYDAITNIVKNCVEHSEQNGIIFIDFEKNSIFTSITNRDKGCGMSKEDIKHIFDRFYKGKNSSEDTVGIGIA